MDHHTEREREPEQEPETDDYYPCQFYGHGGKCGICIDCNGIINEKAFLCLSCVNWCCERCQKKEVYEVKRIDLCFASRRNAPSVLIPRECCRKACANGDVLPDFTQFYYTSCLCKICEDNFFPHFQQCVSFLPTVVVKIIGEYTSLKETFLKQMSHRFKKDESIAEEKDYFLSYREKQTLKEVTSECSEIRAINEWIENRKEREKSRLWRFITPDEIPTAKMDILEYLRFVREEILGKRDELTRRHKHYFPKQNKIRTWFVVLQKEQQIYCFAVEACWEHQAKLKILKRMSEHFLEKKCRQSDVEDFQGLCDHLMNKNLMKITGIVEMVNVSDLLTHIT